MKIDRNVILSVLQENYNSDMSSAIAREMITDEIIKKLTGEEIDGVTPPVEKEVVGRFEEKMRSDDVEADEIVGEKPISKKPTKKPTKKPKKIMDKNKIKM